MNQKYKLVAFDMDGTIAKSKSRIENDMALLLAKLAKEHSVLVVSGGNIKQFDTQLLQVLPESAFARESFFIAPTSGAELYKITKSKIECIYSHKIDLDSIEEVRSAFEEAVEKSGLVMPEVVYGEVFENRVAQLSFSPFGQEAPYEVKKDWDVDRKKRLLLREYMLPKIKSLGLDILIGGTSTIDIVKAGVDKAYVLDKMVEILSISKEEVLYIGDAVFKGGNDYAPKEAGFECINVLGLDETKEIIRKLTA